MHANGTARVQTLRPEDNPFLAEVLSRFAELTGIPVLINTSLNVKGKPICGIWGFLGPGITDTPDGGRSHRATLTDGITDAGHDIVFLQPNRDLTSRY